RYSKSPSATLAEAAGRLRQAGKMAEGEGFEPSVRLRAQRFSRPSRSATPAPLRKRGAAGGALEPPAKPAANGAPLLAKPCQGCKRGLPPGPWPPQRCPGGPLAACALSRRRRVQPLALSAREFLTLRRRSSFLSVSVSA